ncbi:YgjV family protein [Shewanella sp. Isolate13]|uniref:YgjV family protein n=1 Tax=Shewanella sp. Isolate13 TaxID=2908531 RepID=UPI001EFE2515|nr:YgjV family protein [Shewanella sp. Isolate13]MCG9731736.1 YgjV family protein [Shewanella sp. Isolate13]
MSHELIGYLGSVVIAISLLLTNITRLRYLNSAGCLMMVVYALLIGAYPVVLMNCICIMINIYHIVKVERSIKSELVKAD